MEDEQTTNPQRDSRHRNDIIAAIALFILALIDVSFEGSPVQIGINILLGIFLILHKQWARTWTLVRIYLGIAGIGYLTYLLFSYDRLLTNFAYIGVFMIPIAVLLTGQATKRKRIIASSVAGMSLAVTVFAYYHLLPDLIKFDAYELSAEVNASTPITLDSETILDYTNALSEHEIDYHYTLPNFDDSVTDRSSYSERLTKIVLKNVADNEDIKTIQNMGISIRYHYHAPDGSIVSTIPLPKTNL